MIPAFIQRLQNWRYNANYGDYSANHLVSAIRIKVGFLFFPLSSALMGPSVQLQY